MTTRFPMGQPFGWFHVAFSGELGPGDVRPVRFFGRPLVLFRTMSGRPALLEAHCPHLGAHLGHGGVIDGDVITCPFHAWQFTADGVCVDIPYATRKPKIIGKRCIRTFAVSERNRAIHAWHHSEGKRPLFDVADIPDLSADSTRWGPFATRQWTVRSHIQECHENIVDRAHFRYVHDLDPEIAVTFDGHRSRTEMRTELPGMPAPSRNVTHHNGPGQTWTIYDGFPEMIMMNPVTPVDDESVQVNVAVAFSAAVASTLPRQVQEEVLSQMWKQVDNDIPIFENKVYRLAPPFCDNDGPIAEFRRWYRQFYVS